MFAQDPSYVHEIYGEAAIELVLPKEQPEAKILDIVEHPGRYTYIVKAIRRHLTEKHSYEVRLKQLIEIVKS